MMYWTLWGLPFCAEVRETGTAPASISSRLLSPPVWLSHSSSMRLVMVSLALRMVPV